MINQKDVEELKSCIETIPDYPKPGILFRDVTSLLEHPEAFQRCVDLIADHYKGHSFDKVVGTEARGFLFGAPVALALNAGFVPVRKPNKLPRAVYSQTYTLEYGEDTLEIHRDSIQPGERILIIDDLLATGGTILATQKLIQQCGGIVHDAGFVIDLPDLGGQEKLEATGIHCFSLLTYAGH